MVRDLRGIQALSWAPRIRCKSEREAWEHSIVPIQILMEYTAV